MFKTLTRKQPQVRIISWGGIGDALLLTPAFSAIKARHPGTKLHVYYPIEPHRQIFQDNPHIDSLKKFSVRGAPIGKLRHYLKRGDFATPSYGALYPSKFYQVSAVKIIGEMLDVEIPTPHIELYLTDKELATGAARLAPYNNPILMQGVSGCSGNKNWEAVNWQKLVALMPEYTFIQLGGKGETPVEGAINLTGLTLRESFAMMKHARAFVGVDSCFAHASNAFDLPGVVLFGPSTPLVWGHNNNINLYKQLSCAPCLDILLFDPCPYGKKCMEFTPEEVRDALLKQLLKS
jgi:ADP-heptose:LPS heptosyltransferase